MKSVVLSLVLLAVSASAFGEDRLLFLDYEFSSGGDVVSTPSVVVQEKVGSSISIVGGAVGPFSLTVVAQTQEDGTVLLKHQIKHGSDEFDPIMVINKDSPASIRIGEVQLKVTARDVVADTA